MKKNLIATLSFGCLLAISCKPKSNKSEVDTLDNLVGLGDFKLSSCKGDDDELDQLRKLININDSNLINYGNLEQSAEQKQAFQQVLSAVPHSILGAFFGVGGKIILDPNTSSTCASKTNTYASTLDMVSQSQFKEKDKYYSCWVPGTANPIELYLDSSLVENDIKYLRHATVRSFGYIFAELLSKFEFNIVNGQMSAKRKLNTKSNLAVFDSLDVEFQKDILALSSSGKKFEYQVRKQDLNDLSAVNITMEQRLKSFVFAEAFDSYFCSIDSRNSMQANFLNTYNYMQSKMSVFENLKNSTEVENTGCIIGCDIALHFNKTAALANTSTVNNASNSVAPATATAQTATTGQSPGFFSSLWNNSLVQSIGGVLKSTLLEAGENKLRDYLGLDPKKQTIGEFNIGDINHKNCLPFYKDLFDIKKYEDAIGDDENTKQQKAQIRLLKSKCDQALPWKASCQYFENLSDLEASKYSKNVGDDFDTTTMKTDWSTRKEQCNVDWKKSCTTFVSGVATYAATPGLTTEAQTQEKTAWDERTTYCKKHSSWKTDCQYFSGYFSEFISTYAKTEAEKVTEKEEWDKRKQYCATLTGNTTNGVGNTTYTPQTTTPKPTPRKTFNKTEGGGCGVIEVGSKELNWYFMLFGLLLPLSALLVDRK